MSNKNKFTVLKYQYLAITVITYLKGQNQVLKTLAQIIQSTSVLFEIEKIH